MAMLGAQQNLMQPTQTVWELHAWSTMSCTWIRLVLGNTAKWHASTQLSEARSFATVTKHVTSRQGLQ